MGINGDQKTISGSEGHLPLKDFIAGRARRNFVREGHRAVVALCGDGPAEDGPQSVVVAWQSRGK